MLQNAYASTIKNVSAIVIVFVIVLVTVLRANENEESMMEYDLHIPIRGYFHKVAQVSLQLHNTCDTKGKVGFLAIEGTKG